MLDALASEGFNLDLNEDGRYWTNDELAQRAVHADCIFASAGRYDASTLDTASSLKLLVKFGVGYDNIDLEYCKSRGIAVAVSRGANHEAVADYAFAQMLCAATGIIGSVAELRGGTWRASLHGDLHRATVAILGLGLIGRSIARRAHGFDMDILYWDVTPLPEAEKELGARFAGLEEIASEADFVSVNLPLTPETKGLIGVDFLRAMKRTAWLVNTARGGIVDEDILYTALTEGWIAGAASDVFAVEPSPDNKLLGLDNFLGTPHTAAISAGAVRVMAEICCSCVKEFRDKGAVPDAYHLA